MTERRGHGEGGLFWNEQRQRWIAEVTVGYTPAGKRIVRRGSGKTKTAAREKLKEVMRDRDDGLVVSGQSVSVTQAAEDWLAFGLADASPATVRKYRFLVDGHLIPYIGARKLRELTATDVDKWLKSIAYNLSTSTVRRLHETLNRIIIRAMARDHVKRNVVALCAVPKGKQPGRPSKSLTLAEAKSTLQAAEGTDLYAYVVLSLLTGARTEELRALTWALTDLDGDPNRMPSIPPAVQVWTSVREGGDTKTRRSRRTLALPQRAVDALREHRERQNRQRTRAGKKWQEHDLVFASRVGTELLAGNVRRSFRLILTKAGLDAAAWTRREMRHSFVSLLSAGGASIEEIADLCGHAGTRVTEAVYRHQLRPILLQGAVAMDQIFDQPNPADGP
jgi:integrase